MVYRQVPVMLIYLRVQKCINQVDFDVHQLQLQEYDRALNPLVRQSTEQEDMLYMLAYTLRQNQQPIHQTFQACLLPSLQSQPADATHIPNLYHQL